MNAVTRLTEVSGHSLGNTPTYQNVCTRFNIVDAKVIVYNLCITARARLFLCGLSIASVGEPIGQFNSHNECRNLKNLDLLLRSKIRLYACVTLED